MHTIRPTTKGTPLSQIVMLWIFCSLFAFSTNPSFAQLPGDVPGDLPMSPSDDDTVMVFSSPRPLIAEENDDGARNAVWGLDVLFSQNGFGLGAFYRREFSSDWYGLFHIGFSGARNTDEFEQFDFDRGWYVPGKVNRLFMVPVSLGMQKRLFQEDLSESFKPFLQGGVGTTFILATPYAEEFFSAFGSGSFFVRPSGYVGLGAYLGASKNSLTAVNIRYFIIPFGGEGIESIEGFPITDFGGVFLSLSVGW